MYGIFENFEVVTFLKDDVFVLTMGADLGKKGLYTFPIEQIVKFVTQDFLVTALVLKGEVFLQGSVVLELGQIAKSHYDARKLDPKAPYFPQIYICLNSPFEAIPPGTLRRLKQFCAYIQCSDGVYKNGVNNYEKIDDTSWDLNNLSI